MDLKLSAEEKEESTEEKSAPEAAVTESNPALYVHVFIVFLTHHTQNKPRFLLLACVSVRVVEVQRGTARFGSPLWISAKNTNFCK